MIGNKEVQPAVLILYCKDRVCTLLSAISSATVKQCFESVSGKIPRSHIRSFNLNLQERGRPQKQWEGLKDWLPSASPALLEEGESRTSFLNHRATNHLPLFFLYFAKPLLPTMSAITRQTSQQPFPDKCVQPSVHSGQISYNFHFPWLIL